MPVPRRIWATLLLAAGCSQPQPPSFTSVLIDEGLQIANTHVASSGHIFIDQRSIELMRQTFPEGVSHKKGARLQSQRTIQSADWTAAVHCQQPNIGCAVKGDGLFIRVDSVDTSDSTATVAVTFAFTVRPSADMHSVCTIPADLSFVRAGTDVQHVETRVRRRC